jgi:hypothetical protein
VVSSLLNVDFWRRHEGFEKPWWRGGLPEEYLDIWGAYDESPATLAAVQWRRVIEIADRERDIIAEKNYMELRYEDFVSDPHATVNLLMEKCDLSMCKDIYRYLETIGKLKNMNYKYKQNLSNKEIIMIEDITRPVAVKKGYDF